MDITRRSVLAASIGVAAAGALSACGGGSDGGGKQDLSVNFGYIGDFNGTSLLAIADQEGLWAKHGVKAQTKVFTNGPLQIQALGTGDLDFGYIGPGAMWLPAQGKAKLVAINTLGDADRVIAQPGITSIDQLKGKTVGVPEGTSGDMILTLSLEKAGLTKSDVKVVAMDPATLVSAFSSGQIEGAGFWYPAIATIKKSVPDLTELAKNSDFTKTVTFPSAFVAGNAVVADQPEKVMATLKVLRDAMKYRSENLKKTIAATAKMLNIDEATVTVDTKNVKLLSVAELDQLTEDGTIVTWLTGLNEYFIGAGKLPEPVDPKKYYTGDLFVKAGR